MTAWLERDDAAESRRTHEWLCASADAVRADWLHAKNRFVRRSNDPDYEFYKESERWALSAGEHLRALDPATFPTVKALLLNVEDIFAQGSWTEHCPARDAMAKRVDAIWRGGAATLDLVVNRGNQPFDAH